MSLRLALLALLWLGAGAARAEDVDVSGGTLHLVYQTIGGAPALGTRKAWGKACANVGKRLLVGKGPWHFGVFDHFDCKLAGKKTKGATGPWELRAVDDGESTQIAMKWTAPRPGSDGTRCKSTVSELTIPSGLEGLELLAGAEYADLLALNLLDSMPMALPARLVPPAADVAKHRWPWPKQPSGFARFDLAYDLDACLWRASTDSGRWAHALVGRRERLAMETTTLADASEQLVSEREAATAEPGASARPGLTWTSVGGAPMLRGASLLSKTPYLATSVAYARAGGGGPSAALEGLPGVNTSATDELGWWHAGLSWTDWWSVGSLSLMARPSLSAWSFKARQGANEVDLPALPAVGLAVGPRYSGNLFVATLTGAADRAAAGRTSDSLSSGALDLTVTPRRSWSPVTQVEFRPAIFARGIVVEVSGEAKGAPAGTPPTTLVLDQIYLGAGLCAVW